MSIRIYGMCLQDSILSLLLAHKSLHNSLVGSKEVHCLENVIHVHDLD
jgi:hypothetical protein